MSFFDNIVLNFLKKIFTIEESHFYIDNPKTRKKIIDDMKSGIADYPIILLSDEPYYSLNEDWENSDLRNEICVDNDYEITILSKDIDDIISIEDMLKQSLTDPKLLYNGVENSCSSPAKISLITERETERAKSDAYEIYESTVYVRMTHALLRKDIVNPIKIELDSNVANRIMKHLCVLDEAASNVENQMSEILSSDSLGNFQTAECKITNMPADLKEQYDNLRHIYENVTAQISEMYTFENLCKDKLGVEDHSFRFCYRIMTEEKCDLIKAIEICKQKREKEKAEKEKAEKQAENKRKEKAEWISKLNRVFNTPGDRILNHYTDAIVSNVKEKAADKIGVPVYGGSTIDVVNRKTYRIESEETTQTYIWVSSNCDFIFDSQKYVNMNKEGEYIERSYSTVSFPIKFFCTLHIRGVNPQEVNEIRNVLFDIYKNEQIVKVSDLIFPDEFNIIKLKIDIDEFSKDSSEEQKSGRNTSIPIIDQVYVYHTRKIEKSELADNHRLQLVMLQLAKYTAACEAKLLNAMNKVENDYKSLVTKPTGFLSKTFRGTFCSADFKRLQQMFDYGPQIDKELFHRVLKEITDFYPLWDRMCKGWSADQIKEEVKHYRQYFLETSNDIYLNLLEMPTVNSLENYDSSDDLPIDYVILNMTVSPTNSINDALKEYQEYLAQRQARRDEIARRNAEAEYQRQIEREESGYYDQPSSGGGFLSSMLSTAGGVALGNKLSRQKSSKSSKRSLWGTAMCPYGKRAKEYDPKAPNFATISCNIGCPLYLQCGGR